MYLLLFTFEFILLFFLSKLLTTSLARLFFRLTKSQGATISLLFYLFLPGTVIHELSHLLVAGLLFVKTGDLELRPKITEGEVRLGSVSIENTDPFRRAIIGVAPVLVGIAIVFTASFYLQTLSLKNLAWFPILFYIIFEVGNSLFSSGKDLEGTIELLIAITLVLTALFIIRQDFWQAFLIFLQKKELVSFFKNADIFLIVPLVIDLVIIILLRPLVSGLR